MHSPKNPSQTPENRAEVDELADYVLFVQKTVMLGLSPEFNKANVSFPQFFLLAALASEEYLSMWDIAKKMGHTTSAATGLVDRLEKLGLVERTHPSEDRRKIHIRITPKGVEFVAKKREEIVEKLQEMLSKPK